MSGKLQKAPRFTSAACGEVELVINSQHFQRVVRDGILKARISLDIATADFKSMLVPSAAHSRSRSILQVMRDLARKGLEIRVLHSGVPSGPILRELRRDLPASMRIRRCPRLHAKAVVIDCQAMYLGSANLTGAGLGAKSAGKRNFELGIWTCAPALIDPVLEEFNALWEGRCCPNCRRRDVCPVPLEEPRL